MFSENLMIKESKHTAHEPRPSINWEYMNKLVANECMLTQRVGNRRVQLQAAHRRMCETSGRRAGSSMLPGVPASLSTLR